MLFSPLSIGIDSLLLSLFPTKSPCPFFKSCIDEKKDRRGNIRFIKRYFPHIRVRGIPKMAHAELVMIHPEEFCHYADKFLLSGAGESRGEV